MNRHVLSILLENEPGALSRVVGLFSAPGYNIESLTVAPTEDPTLSRLTVVTRGQCLIHRHFGEARRGMRLELADQVHIGRDHAAEHHIAAARHRVAVQHDGLRPAWHLD